MSRGPGSDTAELSAARPAETTWVEPDLAGFVDEHRDRLVRLAYLICRDEADAADAVQAAFEQAWRHLADLREVDRLRPWLDRIVAREAIHASRRRSLFARFRLPRDQVAWLEIPDANAGLPGLEWLAMRTAFAHLPSEQRAVIALHLHLGYSLVETAEIVGAPLETVRSRLRLAKDRLRRELEENRR
jgi:RNA polymerase sigma-70 factor, ECF subfamily